MKKILFAITVAGITLVALAQSTLQRGEITTSRFSREANTNETAAGWRAKLGVGTGSGGPVYDLVDSTNLPFLGLSPAARGVITQATYNIGNSTNLPYLGLSDSARGSITQAIVQATQNATNNFNGGNIANNTITTNKIDATFRAWILSMASGTNGGGGGSIVSNYIIPSMATGVWYTNNTDYEALLLMTINFGQVGDAEAGVWFQLDTSGGNTTEYQTQYLYDDHAANNKDITARAMQYIPPGATFHFQDISVGGSTVNIGGSNTDDNRLIYFGAGTNGGGGVAMSAAEFAARLATNSIDAANITGDLSVDNLAVTTLTAGSVVGDATLTRDAEVVPMVATNIIGPSEPRHMNLHNLKQTEYVLQTRKPLKILHIRDDAINSDEGFYENLNSFLTLNGATSKGIFPWSVWLSSAGVTYLSESAADATATAFGWNGGAFKFGSGGGAITNGYYFTPTTVGTPTVDTINLVFLAAASGFNTYTVLTNSGSGPVGTYTTFEGTHDRIHDVETFTPEPQFQQLASGAGDFNTLSATYVFHIYAYKSVGVTRVYSQNPTTITGVAPASFLGGMNSYDIKLSWVATDGANGYRVVIFSDPENSISNTRYVDVASNAYTVESSEYVTASPPTVTPKSATTTNALAPASVVFKLPSVHTNLTVTLVSPGTNMFIAGACYDSARQNTWSMDTWGGGGGGWGLDTMFRTTLSSNIFRHLMKVSKWDLIFLSDLGNPARYLTQTKNMTRELGFATDIVSTTGNRTRPSEDETMRLELYTNAAVSSVVVVDTAGMIHTSDQGLNFLYYTNGIVTPDGVHTRPMVKTNVMREVFSLLRLNHDGLGKKYGYERLADVAATTNVWYADIGNVWLVNSGSPANTPPVFVAPYWAANGNLPILMGHLTPAASTRQIYFEIPPHVTTGKKNFTMTQYWVTTNNQTFAIKNRLYRSGAASRISRIGSDTSYFTNTDATTNIFTTPTTAAFSDNCLPSDIITVFAGHGDAGAPTNTTWWLRAKIEAY
jgi:hypothetical protein